MLARHLVLCSLVLILAGSSGVMGASTPGMPVGGFLTKPVHNERDLADLIRSDKAVAQRYSKHYGMDAESVAQYIQQHLEVATLDQSGSYVLYYIAGDGRITVHKKPLSAGDRVLVGPDGRPVIRIKCGNPFTKVLPRIVVKVYPRIERILPPTPEIVVAEVLSSPPEEIIPPPPDEEVEVQVLDMPPMELVTSRGSNMLLPALAASGAIGLLSGKNTVVPEPSSMLLLGIGAAGVFVRLRRKSRR